MKKFIFLFLAAGAVFFNSCQKVIDVDLNSKDPQIVIEANVSDQAMPSVHITKTVNFSETNSFPAVNNATVTLADNLGNTEVLPNIGSGYYQGVTMQGVPGRTYYLTVVADGKTYTSQSTMPALVTLDTLVLEPNVAFGPDYYVIPFYRDPLGIGNYYRCIETINHRRVDGSFLFDDQLTDGLINGQPILNFEDSLVTGDTVSIELQCIDKPVNLYFYSLEQTVTGQTGAPANPPSNISNGALGYFSAHTSRSKYVVIP